MTLPTRFLLPLLISSLSFAAEAPKPKFGPQATRLYNARQHIQRADAPDYWALTSYYDPQMNAAACSLASVAMVVNAARAGSALTASDELVTQKNLLAKANSKVWNEGVAKGERGVSLDELGAIVDQSLKAYGVTNFLIETIHADSSAESKKKIHDYLVRNEKSGKDFIIANFLQSEFTGDPEGAVGHISPVGAYDAKSKKVLIMDVDRQYYEPYWVSEETFVKGMATEDKGVKKTRGLVYVKIQ